MDNHGDVYNAFNTWMISGLSMVIGFYGARVEISLTQTWRILGRWCNRSRPNLNKSDSTKTLSELVEQRVAQCVATSDAPIPFFDDPYIHV